MLLADALCYSLWVLVLFSSGAFAPRFNRWTRAEVAAVSAAATAPTTEPADAGGILLWLGIALVVALGAATAGDIVADLDDAHDDFLDGADCDARRV